MVSVGAHLRDLRETRGVTLEEIARTTRVAHRYLDALERDEFDALPAPVFTRGFIRAYCQALGAPPDEALARYERHGTPPLLPPPSARTPIPGSPGEPRARGAVLVSFVLLVVLGLALFTVTLVIQPAPVPGPAPGAPATVGASPPGGAPGARPAVAAETPGGAPAASGAPAESARSVLAGLTSPYTLVIRATDTTWLRVRTDDGRSSEETVQAGDVRVWVSNGPFVLTVGNAGGLALELNGRPLPPIGTRGQVISRLVLPPEAP
jgi:cytoskeletal protein RodZ